VNEQAASLAALNISLLEAIKAGPADSRQALADRAGVVANNLSRKLGSLSEAGLIFVSDVDANDIELTEDGERALAAMVALRDGANVAAGGDGLVYIPFGRIDPWLLNPRTQFDPASIEDMAQSVSDKGVLQPLTVRLKVGQAFAPGADRYEVIIGERRRRGCTLAVERGWVSPDFLIPCQVKDYTDDEALDVAGVENLQRHDLHWMDEAKFYLRLAERGRSGAEIARLAGESVSKRKVQDYCKIARELSPKDVERCYLPDGAEGQLVYSKARDLVGEKKERPALDLSPQLALAFAELIDAATVPEQDFDGTRLAVAIMYRPPVGGPLAKLQDRKLVSFGFGGADRHLEARIPITDEVRQWLAHVGFLADRPAALLKLRAGVVGEAIAATFHVGHWHTPELNAPEPAPYTPPSSYTPEEGVRPDDSHPGELTGGFLDEEGEPLTVLDPPVSDLLEDAEDEPPAYLRRLAGPGDAPPAPAPAVPPEPEALPAMLAIVMLEAAHKIGVEGIERGPDTWGAPIMADYYKDSRGQQLVMKRFIAFLPMGERQLVTIAKAGREWLEQAHGVRSEGGKPSVPLMTLFAAQESLVGHTGGATYSTPWLNKPLEGAPERPAPAAPPDPPPQGEGDREAVEGASPTALDAPASPPPLDATHRALLACYGQLGQLDGLLSRLRAKVTEAQKAEIDQHRKLIDAVRETAKANLPEGMV
jgi:ParB/RepB/Spo0J family partition protein